MRILFNKSSRVIGWKILRNTSLITKRASNKVLLAILAKRSKSCHIHDTKKNILLIQLKGNWRLFCSFDCSFKIQISFCILLKVILKALTYQACLRERKRGHCRHFACFVYLWSLFKAAWKSKKHYQKALAHSSGIWANQSYLGRFQFESYVSKSSYCWITLATCYEISGVLWYHSSVELYEIDQTFHFFYCWQI